MALETGTIGKLAEQLEDAELQAYDVTMITADYPDMDWDDAYAIQDEIRRRKEARGSKITGLKAGLTSFAKMKQMGVETPVFGLVADYMGKPDGGEIKTSGGRRARQPLAAVAMMANHVTARGQLIPAGTFIMTGGVTEAIRVEAGDHIAAHFHDLGTVSMRFT